MVEVLREAADREEPIFDDHMQHVLVHDHVVVRLDSREGVRHNGDQQVDQHDLQEEGRQHEEEPADLREIVSVHVRIEVAQRDLVHICDGICNLLKNGFLAVVLQEYVISMSERQYR